MIRTFLFVSFFMLATVSHGQEAAKKDTIQTAQEPVKKEIAKDSVKVVTDAKAEVPKDSVKVATDAKVEIPKDTVKVITTPAKAEIPEEYTPPIENKEIMGKWQMESTEMADGFYYTYSFLRGNVFVFGNDENEGLNRIISLTGTYYLKKDTLIIYVKQEYDLVGGTPQMSEKLAGSGWEITGGKIMLKDLPIVKEYYLPIKRCPVKDHKKCIEINSMSYYKFE